MSIKAISSSTQLVPYTEKIDQPVGSFWKLKLISVIRDALPGEIIPPLLQIILQYLPDLIFRRSFNCMVNGRTYEERGCVLYIGNQYLPIQMDGRKLGPLSLRMLRAQAHIFFKSLQGNTPILSFKEQTGTQNELSCMSYGTSFSEVPHLVLDTRRKYELEGVFSSDTSIEIRVLKYNTLEIDDLVPPIFQGTWADLPAVKQDLDEEKENLNLSN